MHWSNSARCLTHPLSTFYITQGGNPFADPFAEAREICGLCPVRAQCLAAALAEEGHCDRKHRCGFRAGLTPQQRHDLANKRAA